MEECLEKMLEMYGRKITAIACLTSAYQYLYRLDDEEKSIEERQKRIDMAKRYFNFVQKHVSSCVQNKNAISLYCDVKKELNKYDKS